MVFEGRRRHNGDAPIKRFEDKSSRDVQKNQGHIDSGERCHQPM